MKRDFLLDYKRLHLSFCLALTIALSCKSLLASDSAAPVVLSANCYDGQTIGVCFSKVLDPASATNPANYRLGDTNFTVVQATLRPDQSSVILKLDNVFPGGVLSLLVRNVRDLEGASTPTGFFVSVNNLTGTDIGNPGLDPIELGSTFNCNSGSFEVVAGGSGLEGTEDHFYFINQPWRLSALMVEVRVLSLEAVNNSSSAGLMIRENLTPGSRYFSLLVTPPDIPARDGSSNGFNIFKVMYRDVANGSSKEWPISNEMKRIPGTTHENSITGSSPRVSIAFHRSAIEMKAQPRAIPFIR